MKKLNKTETRILAGRMLQSQVNGAVEKAQNSPEIKSKLATASKLLKAWIKAERKSKQEEHTFKKFVEDNKVLIEGGFGDIILKYDEDWNQHTREWNKSVAIDISSSSQVEERIEEEIIFQQIESSSIDELEGKVIKAIRGYKSHKLLT